MSLIDRLQALFRPRQAQTEPVTLVTPPPRPSTAYQYFTVERDRRSVMEDCRRMWEDDPRVKGIILTLARDAIKGGFELNVEGPRAREAKRIADELLVRVDFWGRVDDWTRLSLRDGDTFLEVGANRQNDIVHVSRKPTLELHRWSDEFDEFYDPVRAFFWTDMIWSGMEPPAGAVFFAEWQMIHARWDSDENSRYGRPLFASARKPYKRMTEGELDIAIRRKTRAGMKYVHSLEDASPSDIDAYRERNKAVLNEPFAAIADFFSNKRTSIQAVQGDAHLNEIEDVLHHIRTFWIASPVPMSLLGYGQDLNRDVLEEQKAQYDRTLEEMSNWVTAQIVTPLVERQWLLRGIWPQSLRWDVEWSSKQAFTIADLELAAKALTMLRASGLFTDETLLRLFSRLVPGFDVEAELKALKDEVAQNEIARITRNAEDEESEDEGAEDEEPVTERKVYTNGHTAFAG